MTADVAAYAILSVVFVFLCLQVWRGDRGGLPYMLSMGALAFFGYLAVFWAIGHIVGRA